MTRAFLTLFLLLGIAVSGFAQSDWKTQLKSDLITISNSKYQVEDLSVISFEGGGSLKYKTTASGDVGLISRDQFLSIFNNISLVTLVSILEEVGLKYGDVKFKTTDEIVGKPDIAIHMEMTTSGIAMLVTTEEASEKETMTWEEFFADN